MGIRFRKSIKIMPGVRVNVSKSGFSTTVGAKGASINIGKKGVYANAGIPGTGVFMREKIVGGSSKTNQQTNVGKMPDADFMKCYEQYSPISIKINDAGKITITDKNDNEITDELFLKKMKSMSAFKEQKAKLVEQWKEKSFQEFEESRNAISELVNIHRYSFDVKPLVEYERELNGIIRRTYSLQAFGEKEPTKAAIESGLVAYAELNISSKAFWKNKKLREQYVSDNLDKEYEKQHSEWLKKKKEFDESQRIKAEKQNAIYEQEYNEAVSAVKELIAGSDEYVKDHMDAWLSQCTLPVEINVDYEYEADTGNMYIDILLPSEEVIPDKELIMLANGGVKEKNKTHQTIQEEYANMIFGLGVCITSGAFDISPAIQRVLTSGYASRRNKQGDLVEECLYSVKYERSGFEGQVLKDLNPVRFSERFENRYKATQTWLFKAIEPFEDF